MGSDAPAQRLDREAIVAMRRVRDRMDREGSCFGVDLATADLDATFAALEAAGVDVVQAPIAQDHGVRDAAVRDPAGTMIRIQETRSDR
ncbi:MULTISPECIES: VOC family protein [unclassified Agrococcus]|uniref:VOC family protein n=1 Tax=unclassified Agrococcus TaxID=2615065 RepID=UPI00361A2B99